VIDRETQARRIEAARVLRGMSRSEASKLFEAEGFGLHDIPRLERADPKLTLTRPRRETLARLLEVPEHWFTAEDSDLFDMPDDRLSRIERALTELRASIVALSADSLRRTREQQEQAGTDHPEERPEAAG
jgi:hypothetical protein